MTEDSSSRSGVNGQVGDLVEIASRRASRWVAPPPSDRIDVAQIGDALRQNLRLIVGVAGFVFALVAAATLLSRMEFRSSGRLYLGELGDSARPVAQSADEIDLSGGAQADVDSEIEIITSRSLVSRAILESGLNVMVLRAGWQPVRYWQWLLSGRDAALLDGASRELAVENTSLTASIGKAQKYEVSFSSNLEYELFASGRLLGHGRLGEVLEVGGLSLTLMPGTAGAPEARSAYELTVSPLDEVTDRVLRVLDVSATKPGGAGEPVKVVTLRFAEASPLLAAKFLRALMGAYLQQRQSWKTENASAAEAFVTKQLEAMRSSLDQIQEKLVAYRTKNGVVVLDSQGKSMTEQIGKYEEQRVTARLQVAAFRNIQRALKGPEPPIEAYLFGEAEDTVLEGLATSLSRARQELTDLEARFNPSAPDLREQRAQVDAQLGAIRRYVTTRLLRSQQNLASLNGIIAQFERKLSTVPGAERGLSQLSRESEVYGRLYSYLLERQQQTAIVKASTISKNRILDDPEVPNREASPQLALRLASLPLGVLLGVALVLVRGFFAGVFQGESEVRRSIGALSVFASVPRRRILGARGRKPAPAQPIVDPQRDVDSGFVEAFRTLRTSLYGSLPSGHGVVLFTSPCPGDGKTTCTLGLASLLAADGKRVLIVDADLRAPTHHGLLGSPPGRGLGTLLVGPINLRDAVWQVSVPVGRCHAIGAREPLFVELLSSERMRRLLSEARAAYDFVLLDAPSVPLVSDALVLAPLADCVLSVLRPCHTARELTLEHIEHLCSLEKSHGVLINDVLPRAPTPRARPEEQRSLRAKARTASVERDPRLVIQALEKGR
jgi:tyrosine-protein kinase Etk/Wzc